MPEIQPFRGILYNTKKVNLSDVVAPPYDVISAHMQKELYEKSEHNIIRLILGKEQDRYNSAATYLRKWLEESALVYDDVPAVYVLTQTFMAEGKMVTRKGFIAACRLEELGKGSVFPHEKTLSKPKEDRLKLFSATEAMFSQIFSLYNDPKGELNDALYGITGTKPAYEVEFENVLNRLWKLTDTATVTAVNSFLKGANILIADGHHRYETALAYQAQCKEANPAHTGNEAYNFVPMFFTNMHDPGLMVFPTHRLLHSLPEFDPGVLVEKLEEHFRITIFSSQNQLLTALPLKKNAFGLVLPTALGFLLLELKNVASMKAFEIPDVVAKLDVSILHTLVLKHILGISEEAQMQKLNLEYIKDTQHAIDYVRGEKKYAQAGFLLNATPVGEVREVAEAGFVLPQKSTYFYPKLLSGLVNYTFKNA